MDLRLKNQNIIVTGGSQGLGFACARALLEEGANVAIVSRSKENLETAQGYLKAQTGRIPLVFVADVGSTHSINELKDALFQRFEIVHGMLLNTGGPPAGTALATEDEEWKKAFRNNLLGFVRLCKAFVPVMIEHRYGRIVAITSSSAKQPLDNLVLSNSMRLGVIGYLKTLASEVARYNIFVNSLLPGPTRTTRLESLLEMWAEQKHITVEEEVKNRTAQIPAGRFGEPQALGDLTAFLLSERNSYITGQSIAVDGGLITSPL